MAKNKNKDLLLNKVSIKELDFMCKKYNVCIDSKSGTFKFDGRLKWN